MTENRKRKRGAARENGITFIRAFAVSMILLISVAAALCGICAAYEGTRSVGFGDNRSAVELIRGADGYIITILDKTLDIGFLGGLIERLEQLYKAASPLVAENI